MCDLVNNSIFKQMCRKKEKRLINQFRDFLQIPVGSIEDNNRMMLLKIGGNYGEDKCKFCIKGMALS